TLAGECKGCDFSCAKEDLKKNEALQRELLERTSRFRSSLLSQLDRVVVTSRYLEEKVSAYCDGERVVRIANAVDQIEQAQASMLGVAEAPGVNLVVVGMINENKGQLDFVRHLAPLIQDIPTLKLHIVGRGDRIQKRIEEVAAESGLSENIVFRGFLGREEIYKVYRECQIVVCPTIWPEPFGRVPLEAGLTRRPVVSFAVGGLKESIVDGETGILVEPDDWEGLRRAIADLAGDPARRFQM